MTATFVVGFTCRIFHPNSFLCPFPSFSEWQLTFSSFQWWFPLLYDLPVTIFAHSGLFCIFTTVSVFTVLLLPATWTRTASPGDTNLLEEPATPGHRLPPISPSALTVCIAWVSFPKFLKKLNFCRIAVKVLLQIENWVRSKKQVVVFNITVQNEKSAVWTSPGCSLNNFINITMTSPGLQMDKPLPGSDIQYKACPMLVNGTGRPDTGRRSFIFRYSEVIGSMHSSKQESQQNVAHQQQEQYWEHHGVLGLQVLHVGALTPAHVVLVCTAQERCVEGARAAQGSQD